MSQKNNNITEDQNQGRNGKESGVEKARYFAFLIYPDSAPEDFMSKLEELGQPMAISPFHDKDVAEVDKSTGEIRYKKPHYHVIYVANNNVTPDSVRKKLKRKLGNQAVNMVQICDSVGNYYKYLTHESTDAKARNKHVYEVEDITLLNNFDIDRYTDLSKEAKDDLVIRLTSIIFENNLSNMVQLNRYITENPACGITLTKVLEAVRYSGGFIRLCMDGVYQEGKSAIENRKREYEENE